ncbi:uncharacterized protein LOC126898547 [Daktulosphaira vitifoliae]|uniref:uncharacterized protein LOC126898547 n=2 Tax=Daktulosphaira vitifoliae TaxID=58002 RepID=UPI0021AA0FFB|nr:uncharacterized protein LOC126898547 [Daktulosphaira vitifoliae]
MCGKFKEARIVLPQPNSDLSILCFKNTRREEAIPLVIYADMESLLVRTMEQISDKSMIIQKHKSMSYCFYLVRNSKILPQNICQGLPEEPVMYRGPDAAKHFVSALVDIGKQVSDIMKINIEMNPLTSEEQHRFNTTKHCDSCLIEFTDKLVKVKDHNHWTAKFRAVLCHKCNLQRRYSAFIPVIMHGLSNYDSHMIIPEMAYDNKDITVIAQSEEKYISFSKTISDYFQLRFIDSYRFLQASLYQLTTTLTLPDFAHTLNVFKSLELVTRKSVFPYEYVDSWEKLDENQLPTRENFYSSITKNTVSEEDYEHAKKMWQHFECKTIGDYSDKYLLVDVMVLADIFEKFRAESLKNYSLDPTHYYSCPALSFDAMLKYTDVNIELITDPDMLLMFELGIRGGLTQVNQRYARANHPGISDYNPNIPHKYLQYLDATNLYGTAMMEPMPLGNFEWSTVTLEEILDTAEDADHGYLVQVDVDYPQHLHDLHNDLPFFPVNERPPLPSAKYKKLMTTLFPKRNYVVHYRTLKQAVKHGVVITKLHKVIKFKQSRWLAPYIQMNTELRKKASNKFEQDLPKYMINSNYGKTLENVRKHQNIQLVCNEDKLSKLVAKPSFGHTTIFNENLVAVHMYKEKINFFKPIFIGQAVLDISKCIMYKFHYDIMQPFYGPERLRLVYMDTDSFIYLILTHSFQDDLKKYLFEYFDTSNYPTDHPCYSDKRKKQPGTFTDECKGMHMEEIVALLPKVYAYLIAYKNYKNVLRQEEVKRLKGISMGVVKHEINMVDYLNCLRNKLKQIHKKISIIRSKHHNVLTVETRKLALSNNYDKRAIVGDEFEYKNVYTKAWGHYSLNT